MAKHLPAKRRGFTLIEVLIVVAIVGILTAIGAPQFQLYQLRSRSSEAKTNLGAIRVAEEAYFSELGAYVSAPPEPPLIPGATKEPFDDHGTAFSLLGWGPEGNVYFSYGVGVTGDREGFVADAGADIDEDGFVQYWGIVKPDLNGVRPVSQVGCNVVVLPPQQIGSCDPANAGSVF